MLAFTDQSGNIHRNAPETRPVLLTLCMMENEVGDLTRRIHNIKERIFGLDDQEKPREIKAINLINPKSITRRTNNKQLADEVINLMPSYNVAVFAAVMERPDINLPRENADILPNRYRFLLERVGFVASEKRSYALLVYDEESQEKLMWKAINNYLFKHPTGKNLRVLEMPLFVKSVITPGVQVADLMAGIIRHYFERCLDKREPEEPFEKWLCELFSIIRSMSVDYINERGTKNYGIFQMAKNNY
ncbi:DUF3800 domain-containing protein [Pelotomaculum propionicicum]|uniref:DUF3800 domain-containing protein n=1 Tax=Pelotomaculum propionicicum TaxID=258475 RepID=UPI003B7BB7B4